MLKPWCWFERPITEVINYQKQITDQIRSEKWEENSQCVVKVQGKALTGCQHSQNVVPRMRRQPSLASQFGNIPYLCGLPIIKHVVNIINLNICKSQGLGVQRFLWLLLKHKVPPTLKEQVYYPSPFLGGMALVDIRCFQIHYEISPSSFPSLHQSSVNKYYESVEFNSQFK